MIGRLILVVAFLIPAVASAYMIWLTWRADDDGKWLFTVFFVFFLFLAASPILPKFVFQPKPEPVSTSTTRFVPHWFMLLAVLVVLVVILMAIVGSFLHR
ncbi:MAG: hypothetical protein Q8J74_04835 [Candidatus Didemnitutus sp.]|nr:hypothetical protein [Candidatus Didemnitutus sp.]